MNPKRFRFLMRVLTVLLMVSVLMGNFVGLSLASNFLPGRITNLTNQNLFYIQDGNVTESVAPPAGDLDGFWASCNSGETGCSEYKDGKLLKAFKIGDGSSITVSNTFDNKFKVTGTVNCNPGDTCGWLSSNQIPINDVDCSKWNPVSKVLKNVPWQTYGGTFIIESNCQNNREVREAPILSGLNKVIKACSSEVYAQTFFGTSTINLDSCTGTTQCNTIDGEGVVIYKDYECASSSDKTTFTQHNQSINLETNAELNRFNDKISSIKVKPGWSIKVFANYFNTNEPWTCITNSRWDLSKDPFENNPGSTTMMAGQITSFIVYHNSNCSEPISCTQNRAAGEFTTASVCGGGSGSTVSCGSLANGKYCGATVGGNPTDLYQCTAGVGQKIQACTYGCNLQPQGTADFCNAAPTTPINGCPNDRNGKYCGSGLGSQYEQQSLYNCSNGNISKINTCTLGCIQKPAGTDDLCRTSTSTGSCPAGGNGNYCGYTLGLNPNNLYSCNNGVISLVTQCSNGCKLENPGTPDACYPSGGGTSTPTQEKVKLWGNSDYTSIRLEIPEGESNAPDRGTLYKSMTIPAGWSVVLYDHPIGQSGREECFSSSSNQLESKGWYNSIDSIKVATTNICTSTESKVVICSDTGHKGNCKTITADVASLGNYGFGNDTLKSIEVRGDWYAVLFEHENYQGNFYQTNSTNGDLGGIPIGYGTSSIKVIKTNPAAFTLYKMGDFNDGGPFRSDRTVTDLSFFKADQGNWNDKAESMRVGGGYEVIACTDSNSHGNCGRTKTDVADLNSLAPGLRDGLTSVIVCKDNCPPTSSIPTMISPISTETFLPGTPISFSWVGNGEEYLVEISGGNLPAPINSGWLKGATVWSKIGLADSTNPYTWRVKSWSTYGETPWSAGSTFKIQQIAPTSVYLYGDSLAVLQTDTPFTAFVSPSAASGLNYVWSPTPKAGQGTASATYNFNNFGDQTISLTISNTGGSISQSKTITIGCTADKFTAQYYSNKDLSGNPIITECEQSIDKNWANSGPDSIPSTVGMGTGRDGDLYVAAGQTFLNDARRTFGTVNAPAGQKNITVQDSSPFTVGDEVLIIEMKGLQSGIHEYRTIQSKSGQVITFTENLTNPYTTGGGDFYQIIKIPHYKNVTVDGTLTVNQWDGNTGGILAFRASGKVQVNGTITATGKGYHGGNFTTPPNGEHFGYTGEGITGNWFTRSNIANTNGGGGGREYNYNNGAGGGYGTAGADGAGPDQYRARGGAAIGDANITKLLFGGGGGAAASGGSGGMEIGQAGGAGGGIILIYAHEMAVAGSVTANGINGGIDAKHFGGGGGAGGSIKLLVDNANLGTNKVIATGGVGGGSRPGGNGGTGRIRVQYCYSLNGGSNPIWSTNQIPCQKDGFSARYTKLHIFDSGNYTFTVNSDDGMRFKIDGVTKMERWSDSLGSQSITIPVSQGEHTIQLDYYENLGNALVKLDWIKISELNRAPIVTQIPAQTISHGATFATFDLDNFVTDADVGDTITWSYSGNTNIQVAVNASTKVVTLTYPFAYAGQESITFTAKDSTNLTASSTAIFEVNPTTIPKIEILNPGTNNPVADLSYVIKWRDADHDSNATIKLYARQSKTSAKGEILIAEGISEDETTNQYTWTTRRVTAGNYYIYAEITDGTNTVTTYSPGYVRVQHGGIWPSDPIPQPGNPTI